MTETDAVSAHQATGPEGRIDAMRQRGRVRRPEPTRTLEVGEAVVGPRGLLGKVIERRGKYDYLIEVPDKRDGEMIQTRYDIRSLSRPGEPQRPEREVARAAASAADQRLKERREPTTEFAIGARVSLLVRGQPVPGEVAEIRERDGGREYRIEHVSPHSGEKTSDWHGARALSPA